MSDVLQEWASRIDINNDGKKDGPEYDNLKTTLLLDARSLWNKCREGKITKVEYNRYLVKMKEILEKRYESAQSACDRYNHERKVIFQETENMISNTPILGFIQKRYRNEKTREVAAKEQKNDLELLRGYTNEAGVYTISVKDFESKLKMDDLNTVNVREMMSYLDYLLKKGKLNKVGLREKFGKNLEQFMKVWHDKFQVAYHINSKEVHKKNNTSIGTEIWNYTAGLFGKGEEEKVEQVLNQVFREDMLGTDNIKEIQSIYRSAKITNRAQNINEGTDATLAYEHFIAEAYNVLGKNQDRKKFQKKFESLLESGFSQFDAVYKMFEGKTDIVDGLAQFQQLMKRLAESQRHEAKLKEQKLREYMRSHPEKFGTKMCELPIEQLFVKLEIKQDEALVAYMKGYTKKKEDAKYVDLLGTNKVAAATFIASAKHKKDISSVKRGIQATMVVESSKTVLNTPKNIAIMNSIMGGQDGTKSFKLAMSDIGEANKLVGVLESKPERTDEEKQLLAELKAHVEAQKDQNRELIKATRNLSDKELTALENAGLTMDSFSAESMVGRIEGGITFADIDKRIDVKLAQMGLSSEGIFRETKPTEDYLAMNGSFSVDHLRQTLSEGRGSVISLGGENISIRANGSGFDVTTGFDKREYCSSIDQVENFLDSRKFFHEVGCGFMMDGISEVLNRIRQKNPGEDLRFDMKKGFDKEERLAFMQTMTKAFDLPIELDTKNEGAAKQMLKAYFFTHTSDNTLESDALKQKFIVNGSFAIQSFLEFIPHIA